MSFFVSSSHTFSDPIRYFKENDPYVYFVDNIPIKQLQENDLWLKDQLANYTLQGEFTRRQFAELKPYVNGSDRVLRVKPGNFIARINDIKDRDKLQNLKKLTSTKYSSLESDQDFFTSWGTTSVDLVIDRIQSEIGASSLNLNGLETRYLSYPKVSKDIGATVWESTNGWQLIGVKNSSPHQAIHPLISSSPIFKDLVLNLTWENLPRAHVEFTKMWRAPARTAVVDVPYELTLDIDAFTLNDFYYWNEGGDKVLLDSAVRIDLVFLYSKSIDQTTASIQKNLNSGTNLETISTPQLGVIEGAAFGVNYGSNTLVSESNFTFSEYETISRGFNSGIINSDETSHMLPNPADQNNTSNGFQACSVHGSFPVPEDLLNLAPEIVENIADNSIKLAGQSVLPVCYIVVRQSESFLGEEDIIDIRPFFRTAELTYPERAGIMAGNLSLANRAVGRFELDDEINKIQTTITTVTAEVPRVVAGGTIYGGRLWGPEGAIDNILGIGVGTEDPNNSIFPTVNFGPDWSLAHWWETHPELFGSDTGERRNDRINMYTYFPSKGSFFDGGASGENRLGMGNHQGAEQPVSILWCSKEIMFDSSKVPWMDFYTVECQFEHCIPITSRAVPHDVSLQPGTPAGIWVERKSDRFVINVAWAADDVFDYGHKTPNGSLQPKDARDAHYWSGFVVRNRQLLNGTNNNKIDVPGILPLGGTSTVDSVPKVGACTYPTVTFQVTGYPSNYYSTNLSGPFSSGIILK